MGVQVMSDNRTNRYIVYKAKGRYGSSSEHIFPIDGHSASLTTQGTEVTHWNDQYINTGGFKQNLTILTYMVHYK